jgi:hypothetical protein
MRDKITLIITQDHIADGAPNYADPDLIRFTMQRGTLDIIKATQAYLRGIKHQTYGDVSGTCAELILHIPDNSCVEMLADQGYWGNLSDAAVKFIHVTPSTEEGKAPDVASCVTYPHADVYDKVELAITANWCNLFIHTQDFDAKLHVDLFSTEIMEAMFNEPEGTV